MLRSRFHSVPNTQPSVPRERKIISLPKKPKIVTFDGLFGSEKENRKQPEPQVIGPVPNSIIDCTESIPHTLVSFDVSELSADPKLRKRQVRHLVQRDDGIRIGDEDPYMENCHESKLRREGEEGYLAIGCLEGQTWMTEKLRLGVVKWMTDVHHRLHFNRETIFKAIHVFDKVLTVLDIRLESLQMIGMASLLIAAKYEDMISPDLDELLEELEPKIESNRASLKKTEVNILMTIQFSLLQASPLYFLEYYASKCLRRTLPEYQEALTRSLARSRFYLEISLQDYELTQFKPSLLSLCIWIQNITNMEHIQGYDLPTQKYETAVFNKCFSRVARLISSIQKRYPNVKEISESYR
ncbi:cyclin-O protein B-like [Argonauta hians]